MSAYYKIVKNTKTIPFLRFFDKSSLTIKLILINVAIFFFFLITEMIVRYYNFSLIPFFALQAQNLFEKAYIWTLITSIFMHNGLPHLLVNMLTLYFLGSFLEMIIGKKRYFWFYILSGIFSGLFFAFLAYYFGVGLGEKIFGSASVMAVGASGALFGIAGVLAVLTPRKKVYLILGPIVALVLIEIVSVLLKGSLLVPVLTLILAAYAIISITSIFFLRNSGAERISLALEIPFWSIPLVAIVPLVIIGLFFDLPIGNMAHLGGFIAGFFYGLYLRLRYKKKTQRIAEYFSH
jgi:membrane associated rhomboid family serine protease